MSMFPLTLDQVMVRRRGKAILGPVDLIVDQGGPLIILGPNGSGKTTLLRVMHGIERINAGRVTWACLLYTSPSPRDQRGSRMPSSA